MRRYRPLDEFLEVGAAPVLMGEDVVRLCQGHQPAAERTLRLRQAGGGAQGLAGDRLDDRQRVLHAVIELVDQQLALLFSALALGDVEADLDRADDPAAAVVDRTGAGQKSAPGSV